MRRHSERGTALLEAPAAICILLTIGFSALFIGNLVLRYHQLEEAVRAGSRYGSRAYFAPNGGGQRRRTAQQISDFTVSSASPVVATVEIRCGSSLNGSTMTVCGDPQDPSAHPPGSYLQVRATATVAQDDPIMALARSVNVLFRLIRVGDVLPNSITLSDSAVATIE
jgi:hypothetical protein